MHESNISTNQPMKSRVIVFRSSDRTFLDMINMVRSTPDCYLIYSRSSLLKLKVEEVPF